jgi:integrase
MYLCKYKKQSHNSASALMSCFNRILQPAIKNGVLKRNPITEEVLSRKPVSRDYLEPEEIARIEQLTNLSESLDHKRNVFLFTVFTGLAYADIKALTNDQIRKDSNGLYYIDKGREKNGSLSIVPLLPPAVRILEKYTTTGDIRDFQWKIAANTKMNLALKEIARKANISRNVFMHLGRHTFATTVTLTNGVSIETISKMLGHTTLKHTQIYAKVVSKKVKDEMMVLAEKFQ